MPTEKEIGEAFRLLRAGRSQTLLASLLGVSARTIQRAEEGEFSPVLIRAAQAFRLLDLLCATQIVCRRGLVLYRNELAASFGAGECGEPWFQGYLFQGFFGPPDGPPVTTSDLIKPILARPDEVFPQPRVFKAWKADGSSPIYRVTGNGIRIQYLEQPALAVAFTAEVDGPSPR